MADLTEALSKADGDHPTALRWCAVNMLSGYRITCLLWRGSNANIWRFSFDTNFYQPTTLGIFVAVFARDL
jgi:hypothetical protein